MKGPKVPRFATDCEDVETWLQAYEEFIGLSDYGEDDNTFINKLTWCVDRALRDWYKTDVLQPLRDRVGAAVTWDSVRERFLQQSKELLGTRREPLEILRSLRLRKNETIASFRYRHTQAVTALDFVLPDSQHVKCLAKSVGEPYLSEFMRDVPRSLDAAFEMCLRIEKGMMFKKGLSGDPISRDVTEIPSAVPGPQLTTVQSVDTALQTQAVPQTSSDSTGTLPALQRVEKLLQALTQTMAQQGAAGTNTANVSTVDTVLSTPSTVPYDLTYENDEFQVFTKRAHEQRDDARAQYRDEYTKYSRGGGATRGRGRFGRGDAGGRYTIRPRISRHHIRTPEELIKDIATSYIPLTVAEAATYVPQIAKSLVSELSTRAKGALRVPRSEIPPFPPGPTNKPAPREGPSRPPPIPEYPPMPGQPPLDGNAPEHYDVPMADQNQLTTEEIGLRQNTPTITGRLYDGEQVFTLDGGAELCLINEQVLKRACPDVEISCTTNYVARSANDTKDQPVGLVRSIPVTLAGITIPTTFVVMKKSSYDILLGAPFIQHVQGAIVWRGRIQYFEFAEPDGPRMARMKCAEANPFARALGVSAEDEVLELADCFGLNCSAFDVNRVLSDQERLDRLMFGPAIPETDQAVARKKLRPYATLFAWTEFELGRSPHHFHHIETTTEVPIRRRGYRLPPHLREEFGRLIANFEAAGIMTDGDGEWLFPAFLIPKKAQGQYRLVCDFRELNRVTKLQDYPLPFCPDLQDLLAGHDYYTILDAQHGFYQVELDDTSSQKCQIDTPFGPKRFLVMPMGITNAPSSFQKVMEQVLRDLLRVNVVVFIDDLAIYTNGSFNIHIDAVCQVLDRLQKSNIHVAGKKCKIGLQQILYVGSVCDKEGIRPDPAKLEKIRQWQVPTNRTELRAFLGLVGYYRRHIKNFALIAFPLTDLLKTTKPFHWTIAATTAVHALKEVLLTSVVLAKPVFCDVKRPFHLSADAQDVAVGYVLEQADASNRMRPIAFGGRKFKLHERNYTVTEKECLAVISAIRHFNHYLQGAHFILWVDHSALTWLFSKTDLSGRLTRWILKLQSYSFEIKYRKGTQHGHADGMSRGTFSEHDVANIQAITAEALEPWILEQEGAVLRHYLTTLETPPLAKRQMDRFLRFCRNFAVHEGQLYRRSKQGPPRKVLFSQDDRQRATAQCHEGYGGHKGRDATCAAVARRFWWPGLWKEVAHFVRTCEPCQLRDGQKMKAPLKAIPLGGPFTRVHLDFVGPLTPSFGHKYLLVARDSFTGWAEVRPTSRCTARVVVRFIREELIARHGAIPALVFDQGAGFIAEAVTQLCNAMEIQQRFSSAYHPQSNGTVERMHRDMAASIAKLVRGKENAWITWLHAALLADRVTVKSHLGHSPFFLVYGREALLPVDFELGSFAATWDKDTWMTTDQLLWRRMSQIYHLTETWEAVRARVELQRERMAEYFNRANVVVERQFVKHDIVVVYDDLTADQNLGKKFAYRWKGPLRVHLETARGSLILCELDGTICRRPFARDRVKHYHFRE